MGLGRIHVYAPDAARLTEGSKTQPLLGWIVDINLSRITDLTPQDAEQQLPVLLGLKTPVRGLMGLSAAFALLIGPIAVGVLTLLRRRMWLLWLIPVASLAFSAAVLGYTVLAEGTQPSLCTRSATLLDQRTRDSVTLALRGYYTPFALAEGIHLNADTFVRPQAGAIDLYSGRYYSGYESKIYAADLTNGQHLTSGWLTPRSVSHLQLVYSEPRRERLDLARTRNGDVAITNGLGSDVTDLQIFDHNGRYYKIPFLAAGERMVSEPWEELPDAERLQKAFGGLARALRDAGPRLDYTLKGSGTPRLGTYRARLADPVFVETGLDTPIAEHRNEAEVIGYFAPLEQSTTSTSTDRGATH